MTVRGELTPYLWGQRCTSYNARPGVCRRGERQINVTPSPFEQSFAQWPRTGDTRPVDCAERGSMMVRGGWRPAAGRKGLDCTGYITRHSWLSPMRFNARSRTSTAAISGKVFVSAWISATLFFHLRGLSSAQCEDAVAQHRLFRDKCFNDRTCAKIAGHFLRR